MTEIDALKKVNLAVEAGRDAATMNLTDGPQTCDFIFGIGADGLTPFEKELAGKSAGDDILFKLNGREACKIFGHIDVGLPRSAFQEADVFIRASVKGVAPASSAEVVKSLANLTACGGCSCCGDH